VGFKILLRAGVGMIKKLIIAIVLIAIVATAAYQLGWLSYRGEKVYENTKDSVVEKGKEMLDKGQDAIK